VEDRFAAIERRVEGRPVVQRAAHRHAACRRDGGIALGAARQRAHAAASRAQLAQQMAAEKAAGAGQEHAAHRPSPRAW